jgi:hypothetical protein
VLFYENLNYVEKEHVLFQRGGKSPTVNNSMAGLLNITGDRMIRRRGFRSSEA